MKRKRFISIILSAAMALSCVTLPTSAAYSEYSISTAEELQEFSKLCSLDSSSMSLKAVIKNDIDITGKEFTPIPIFCGTLDGQGHTIKGLCITDQSGRGFINIIGENAVVKNLNIIGIVHPSDTAAAVGGIAGTNNGAVFECTFTGKVSGATSVGGITGENIIGSSVYKCTSVGTVEGTKFTGGITGKNSGAIVQCVNNTSVNTSNEEKKHSLEDIDLSSLTDYDSYSEGDSSSTDTGGIAGFSTGTILSCENNGNIGYPHIGYNIGGIAGRSSGLTSNCVNNGILNGRKDIGGIIGQMEPYIVTDISPDNIDALRDELKTLTNLINSAVNETRDNSLTINSTLEEASGYLKNATDSADNIQKKLSDYGDKLTSEFDRTSSVIADAIERLDKITGEIPDATDSLSRGTNGISEAFSTLADTHQYSKDTADRLRILSDKINASSEKAKTAAEKIGSGIEEISNSLKNSYSQDEFFITNGFYDIVYGTEELAKAVKEISDAIQDISNALSGGFDIFPNISNELSSLSNAVSDASKAISQISSGAKTIVENTNIDVNEIYNGLVSSSDGFKALSEALDNMEGSSEHINSILDNTNSTGDDVNSSVTDLSDAFSSFTLAGERFSEISDDISELFDFLNNVETVEIGTPDESIRNDTEDLYSALTSFISAADTLNVQASNAGLVLSDSLVQINEHAYAAADIITDMLDIDDDEEYIKDTSEDGTDRLTSGKVSGCDNLGDINGDINVGGIAGQIAIEYDYDPEDDISGKISSALNKKLETKAAAINNRSFGTITAKKNYAGGIAGQMSLGIIKNCESYGKILSESGDYVGGTVGKSTAKIIGCYAKAILSGGSYIGGIAGSGDVINDCRAIVDITEADAYYGAICGSSEGEFTGNYFVSDVLCGIDGASYKGKAEPIPYQMLMSIPNVPEEFKFFTLKFIADDNLVDEISFSYGESFDENILPQIPEKDGCYAQWDYETLNGLHLDKEIYAEYFTVISTLGSKDDEKPIWLAEGSFTENDEIDTERMEYTSQTQTKPFLTEKTELCECWKIYLPDDGSENHILRYLLNSESKKEPDVYIKLGDEWTETETRLIGSYLSFEAAGTSPEILIVYRTLDIPLIIIASLIVIAIIVIVILLIRKTIKKVNS